MGGYRIIVVIAVAYTVLVGFSAILVLYRLTTYRTEDQGSSFAVALIVVFGLSAGLLYYLNPSNPSEPLYAGDKIPHQILSISVLPPLVVLLTARIRWKIRLFLFIAGLLLAIAVNYLLTLVFGPVSANPEPQLPIVPWGYQIVCLLAAAYTVYVTVILAMAASAPLLCRLRNKSLTLVGLLTVALGIQSYLRGGYANRMETGLDNILDWIVSVSGVCGTLSLIFSQLAHSKLRVAFVAVIGATGVYWLMTMFFGRLL